MNQRESELLKVDCAHALLAILDGDTASPVHANAVWREAALVALSRLSGLAEVRLLLARGGLPETTSTTIP